MLVTGASGGIGRALTRQSQGNGCRVAAVGRDADRLADVDAAVRIVADTTTTEGAALAIVACHEALGAAPSDTRRAALVVLGVRSALHCVDPSVTGRIAAPRP